MTCWNRSRAILLLLPLLVLAGTAACHAPVTIVTPQGKVAYAADQIVLRVNELQNAAIAAEASGALPTATARIIVQFAVSADRILAAAPSGWQATLAASWAQTKTQLPPIQNPALVAAISALDIVIGGLQ